MLFGGEGIGVMFRFVCPRLIGPHPPQTRAHPPKIEINYRIHKISTFSLWKKINGATSIYIYIYIYIYILIISTKALQININKIPIRSIDYNQ